MALTLSEKKRLGSLGGSQQRCRSSTAKATAIAAVRLSPASAATGRQEAWGANENRPGDRGVSCGDACFVYSTLGRLRIDSSKFDRREHFSRNCR